MPYEEDRARPAMGHRGMLEEREQLVISGVEEVECFDGSARLLTPAEGRRGGRGCTLKSCLWTGGT